MESYNMAVSNTQYDSEYLRGIVDMGSNGIRFSISSVQPPTARIMPTLYQSRAGISLYDAQYSGSGERRPIDDVTIESVIRTFTQFARTCKDFNVPEQHVTVLATEATRTATNSEDFRSRIKAAVGWEVTMLAKEEEGRVGAMGIASSLPEISGLVMDLGGGSTQLSWLINESKGKIQMPESGAVSLPYGAAAMSGRLAEAQKNGTTSKLKSEVQEAVKTAYESLRVPSSLDRGAKKAGGFTLYLSGGGFRGWGYVLMSRHRIRPYPIPVINGFRASRDEFMGVDEVKAAAAAVLENDDDEIFRVSDRRASQVPAVAFFVNALAETLPMIKEVRFCQGGVREGHLFTSLSAEVQSQHPLVVATQPHSPSDSKVALKLLQATLPLDSAPHTDGDYSSVLTEPIFEAFANMIYYHSSHSKDLQASAGLRSTTSGILAGVHGLLHEHRCLLALLLCARWEGETPPTDETFKRNLEELVESRLILWWVNYLGAVAALIGAVYPAGVGANKSARITMSARWSDDNGKQAEVALSVGFAQDLDPEMFSKELKAIEKLGKKKNWVGGKGGTGYKVAVETSMLPT